MLKDVIPPEILPSKEKLIDLLISIKRSCRNDNPYRNFEHGFVSCHLFYCIIKKNAHRFTQYEIFGTMLGLLGHVVDNRVVDSKFIRRTNDPLVHLYADGLGEKHNSIFLLNIIVDLYHLFDHLQSNEKKLIMDQMERSIFITINNKIISRFNRINFLVSKNAFHWSNEEHRELTLNSIIHLADNYMAVKPYISAKRWLELLHQEKINEVRNGIYNGSLQTEVEGIYLPIDLRINKVN